MRSGFLDIGILLSRVEDEDSDSDMDTDVKTSNNSKKKGVKKDTAANIEEAENDGRESPSNSSSNGATSHWIVSVEGQSDEEDVSERNLGRILNEDSDDDEEEEEAASTAAGNAARRSKTKVSAHLNGKTKPHKKARNSIKYTNGNNNDEHHLVKKLAKEAKKEEVVKVRMLTGKPYVTNDEHDGGTLRILPFYFVLLKYDQRSPLTTDCIHSINRHTVFAP